MILPTISMLEVGRAAEHIVVADLIMQGIPAFLTDQGLPFDVVADVSGRLVRIQVKGTLVPRNVNCKGKAERMAYSFSVRRVGKLGRKRLTNEQCDVIALVAMDIRAVAYLPVSKCASTVCIDAPGGRMARVGRANPKLHFNRSIDQYPFKDSINATA